MNTDQAFYLRVSEALAGCQLVEQQLKLYISLALDLIRRRVGKDLPFKMTGEDFADSSLEGLIKQFNKLSDAPQLVKALNAFKTERNFLSHRGITHCLDPEGEVDYVAAESIDDRLVAIRTEADRLRIEIWNEASKFAGILFVEEMESEPPASP